MLQPDWRNRLLAVIADPNIALILMMIGISGLIFELPMIAYFLARFGIMTPAFMRHYRRHAIVAILMTCGAWFVFFVVGTVYQVFDQRQ